MISKTAEYALRAVACLAWGEKKLASADFLAEKTQIPRRYLHRVLQDLGAADLVRSRPGPGGGYELSQPLNEITILDVVNAVSPLERIRQCPLGLKSHTQLCPMHSALDQTYAATEKTLRGLSLQKLLDSANPIPPLCELVTEGFGTE